MSEDFKTNGSPNHSGFNGSSNDYLERAASACAAGDMVLGMYLYLAAYEEAAADPNVPDGMALGGLLEAWHLACDLKERSMAEYVFEKLEPFLTPEEVSTYASELQDLALDRLEEFGFSRQELEEMADMISQDLMGADGSLVKVESISLPPITRNRDPEEELRDLLSEDLPVLDDAEADLEDESDVVLDVTIDTDALSKRLRESDEGSGPTDGGELQELREDQEHAIDNGDAGKFNLDLASVEDEAETQAQEASLAKAKRNEPPVVDALSKKASKLDYSNLVGYDEAIAVMRDLGIGLQNDAEFKNFVDMLNSRHGLSRMPSMDTVLFRASAIEDAQRFLEATVGEIGLPVLRMSMEENLQGMSMLCISTLDNKRPRMNHAQNRFEGPGILVIEDLDMWVVPTVPDSMEGIGGFMMANISRGAREAVSLIRSAVEDPEVYVFATASIGGEVDPFFYDILEPMTVIEIGNPSEQEREDIWGEIIAHHPSMASLDKKALARLSTRLARYDIYLTAREALEDAYKNGLVQRRFMPVTAQNVYDKLAACHTIESKEYRALEDEVVREFQEELERLDDLLDHPEL